MRDNRLRHVFIHHHVFKNAGTSLDDALERFFGADFGSIHDPSAQGAILEDDLIGYLNGRPSLSAVSSHHFHGRRFAAKGFAFFELALIRRPMARFVSIYRHTRRESGEVGDAARRLSIDLFVRDLIDRSPHQVDNPQVNIFANHGFYGRATNDSDLARARERLSSFSLCAPVERFEEALVTLEYFNAPVFGQLDLAFIRQNVSEDGSSADHLAAQISEGNKAWLMAMNRRDHALWKFCDAELTRRTSMVPQFAQRLDAFRGRCAALTQAAARSTAAA